MKCPVVLRSRDVFVGPREDHYYPIPNIIFQLSRNTYSGPEGVLEFEDYEEVER